MADHVLSTQARKVLTETTTGPYAKSDRTTLARIQRILGTDESGEAEVVILELRAAGYVRHHSEGGKLIKIRASPEDPRPGLLLSEIGDTADQVRALAASLDQADRVSKWAAAHGSRAQALLRQAVERAWFEDACSFAIHLGRLWLAAGQPDRALAALELASAAARGRYSQHQAEEHMCRADVLSAQDQHDEAEAAATAAIACAWQASAVPGLVASAYRARASIHARTGQTAWAVDDHHLAAIATTPDNLGQLSPDLAAPRAEDIGQRYLERIHSLKSVLADQSRHGTLVNTDTLVTLVDEVMLHLQQADPTGHHVASLIRTARQLLPGRQAAEFAEIVGSSAQRCSLYTVARASYQDSLELYRAEGSRAQADRVVELRQRLIDVPDEASVPRPE